MNLRRVAIVTAIVAGVLVVLATAAVAGLRLVHDGEILPGTEIAGVDVGGLSPADAREALAPTVADRESAPVTLTFREEEFTLTPTDVDLQVDLDATVAAAMDRGREGGLLSASWDHVSAYWDEGDLSLDTAWDEQAVRAWVGDIAETLDREPSVGDVTPDPETLEVTVRLPHDGIDVRQDEAVELVNSALGTPGPDTEGVPAAITPAPVEDAALRQVAQQMRRALREPLTLTSQPLDTSVTLEPSRIAQLVDVERVDGEDGTTVALDVPVGLVRRVFPEIAPRFAADPVSASFDAPSAPPVTLDDQTDVTWSTRDVPELIDVVPSQQGYRFDAERAATQLTEALQQGLRSLELRLETIPADVTTEDLRELNVTELLGTFTTYHSCCQNRVANIHRLADMVDGTVVRPGEQFSINQISGVRECSKGFAAAGMILRGEIVDVCGGGVSQFGTTTINAVFFAGLEPDTYKPHSFYISRYPMGREATLNYPSPDIDVRFTNTTGNGILVTTSYTSTSITVSIYGNNDVDTVTAVHGSPHSYRSPETRYRENDDLAPGQSRVVQSGRSGFSVGVTRIITYEDGTEERDDWSNTYVPQHEIIERNTT